MLRQANLGKNTIMQLFNQQRRVIPCKGQSDHHQWKIKYSVRFLRINLVNSHINKTTQSCNVQTFNKHQHWTNRNNESLGLNGHCALRCDITTEQYVTTIRPSNNLVQPWLQIAPERKCWQKLPLLELSPLSISILHLVGKQGCCVCSVNEEAS